MRKSMEHARGKSWENPGKIQGKKKHGIRSSAWDSSQDPRVESDPWVDFASNG